MGRLFAFSFVYFYVCSFIYPFILFFVLLPVTRHPFILLTLALMINIEFFDAPRKCSTLIALTNTWFKRD